MKNNVPESKEEIVDALLRVCSENISAILGSYCYVMLYIKKPSVETIRDLVVKNLGISWEQIISKNQKNDICDARNCFIWLCKEYLHMNYVPLGELLNRHHSSIIHSKNKIDDMMLTSDPAIEKGLLPIIEELKKIESKPYIKEMQK